MKYLNTIISVLLLLAVFPLSGQFTGYTFNDCTSCPSATEVTIHLAAGVPLTASNIRAATTAATVWSYQDLGASGSCSATFDAWPGSGSGVVDIAHLNLRFDISDSSPSRIIISSIGGNPLTEGEHKIALGADQGLGRCDVVFTFIVRKPRDILFVLDRSGSMNREAAPGTDARWPLLSSALDNFVAKMFGYSVLPTDRMNVLYFNGSAPQIAGLDDAGFESIADFQGAPGTPPSTFFTELNGIAPGGSTSIGTALYDAFTTRLNLPDPVAREKFVVLFTDGEQNTGWWVKDAGAGIGRIIEESRSNSAEVLNLNTVSGDNIEILTASAVVSPAGVSLLNAIGKEAENSFFVVPGDEASFVTQLSTDLFNRLNDGFSPRFVARKEFVSGPAPQRLEAPLNAGVDRLTVEAAFSRAVPRGAKVLLNVYKDGVEVTRTGLGRGNPHFLTRTFTFHELPELTSDGNWTAEVISGSMPQGTKVTLMLTADDHDIHFSAGTLENDLIAGESIRPRLTLTEGGRPVSGATVTATISRPDDDIGDLLARTPVNNLPPLTDQYASCAELKYDLLQRDKPAALANLLRREVNTITLTKNGNGTYTGVFSDTDVTGVYKIRYDVSYVSPRRGKVVRTEEQTSYVGFPAPDLNLTARAIKGETVENGYTITTARPSFSLNGKKRLIGPGFATAFGVNNPAVRLSPTDNCNGSYQLRVSGPPKERFTLYLLEDEVFSGTVKEFNEGGNTRPKGYLSLSGGRTLPRGDFDRRFDEGIYGQIGLGRRFGSLLGAELVGGYYSFEPDFRILGGTGYLNVYLGGDGATGLMVGAGPGYYFPEGGDARLGGSVRAALERRFGRLSLGVEGGYFRLTDPEIDFATLGLRATIGL